MSNVIAWSQLKIFLTPLIAVRRVPPAILSLGVIGRADCRPSNHCVVLSENPVCHGITTVLSRTKPPSKLLLGTGKRDTLIIVVDRLIEGKLDEWRDIWCVSRVDFNA